jgi:hypothetical protein
VLRKYFDLSNLVYYIMIYTGHIILLVSGYSGLAYGYDEGDKRYYVQNFDGKPLGKCPHGTPIRKSENYV